MEGQSSLSSSPRKPVFRRRCCGRLYEKERESHGFEQARSADLLSLFLSASRMRWLRHRPAPPVRVPHSQAALTRNRHDSHQSGNPRSLLRERAKHAEKETGEKSRQACLQPFSPVLFHTTAASITQPTSNTNAGSLLLSCLKKVTSSPRSKPQSAPSAAQSPQTSACGTCPPSLLPPAQIRRYRTGR